MKTLENIKKIYGIAKKQANNLIFNVLSLPVMFQDLEDSGLDSGFIERTYDDSGKLIESSQRLPNSDVTSKLRRRSDGSYDKFSEICFRNQNGNIHFEKRYLEVI